MGSLHVRIVKTVSECEVVNVRIKYIEMVSKKFEKQAQFDEMETLCVSGLAVTNASKHK